MNDLREPITKYSDTAIKDQKVIDFINNIKSVHLRSIVRNHFEHECEMINSYYSLDNFKEDFTSYLNNKEAKYYFLPGLDSHYESILKKLLGLEKWNNERSNENDN